MGRLHEEEIVVIEGLSNALKETANELKKSAKDIMPDFFKDMKYDKNIDINEPVDRKKDGSILDENSEKPIKEFKEDYMGEFKGNSEYHDTIKDGLENMDIAVSEVKMNIKDIMPDFFKDIKYEKNADVSTTIDSKKIESNKDTNLETDEKESIVSYDERIKQTPINNGHWSGERGKSKFVPDDIILQKELKKYNTDGIEYKGGYPDFSPCTVYEAELSVDKLQAPNVEQKKECNKQLKDAIEANPELAKKFSKDNLEQIENGITPKGYVWHHDIETGKMQLVPEVIHKHFGHVGGQKIWAGGTENR